MRSEANVRATVAGVSAVCMLSLLLAACEQGYCTNTCATAHNGVCEDGVSGSSASTCAFATDCSDCSPRFTGGGGWPAIPSGPPSEAEEQLNALLRSQYPDGAPAGDVLADESIDIASTGVGDARAPLTPRDGARLAIGYTSSSSPVNAICIGFGSRSSAWCVPTSNASVSATGTGTSGALALPLVTDSLCSMLSSICHDIRCYEFARTSAGSFSRSNISMLAAACGGCDEPSCQSLLEMCMTDDCGGCTGDTSCVDGMCVGEGALRFTLQWSSSSDFDLHVTTPSGSTISFMNRTADSGNLDVDDTSGGAGSVENVFFTSPPSGTYRYWVDNYSGSGGSFTLTAYAGGTVRDRQSGSLGTGGESTHYTLSYP